MNGRVSASHGRPQECWELGFPGTRKLHSYCFGKVTMGPSSVTSNWPPVKDNLSLATAVGVGDCLELSLCSGLWCILSAAGPEDWPLISSVLTCILTLGPGGAVIMP